MNDDKDQPEFLPLDLGESSKDTDELPLADVVTQRELESLNLADSMLRLEISRIQLRLSQGAIIEPGPRRISRTAMALPSKPKIKFATDPDSSLDVAADIRREEQQQQHHHHQALPPRQHRRRAPQPTITIAGLKRKYWLQLLAAVDIATPKGREQVMLFIDGMRGETEELVAAHRTKMRVNRCWNVTGHLRLIVRLKREYWLLRGALALHQADLGDWRGCVAERGTRILALREQLLPANA